MEIKGKIVQMLEATSGTSARGEWKKQDFILETQDQYPKKVCISNWNNKVNIDTIPKDAVITASINHLPHANVRMMQSCGTCSASSVK